MITVEMLEQRKAQALADKDQMIANANALAGVVQDCDHWISVLKQLEEAQAKLKEMEEKPDEP